MSLEYKERLKSLKISLAQVFDDNLHTRKWHNIVDWLIIAMILLSTAEIFLSTFDVDPALRRVLFWVDIVTLVFFTIEVSLRLWVAPQVNPKFSGWKGRLRYCFTFYGAIDILSTFPFYLQWFFPLPVEAFRFLRTARVIRTVRIGRYSRSFNLLSSAIGEKRRELIVSMQFLVVITLILSLILFFAEHDKQPDVYKNGFISVVWAFAQYIGDPGQFADTPPVTGIGRIIACIVGLLGIAIVAVPAGIIGAGFTEALEKDSLKRNIKINKDKIHKAFQRKLDRPTSFQVTKPFKNIQFLQARLGLKQDEIIDAVTDPNPPYFRLISTASTIPTDKKPVDLIAVEHFVANRSYGLMIDRNSPITIISPSSMVDPGTGYFAFYLALFGGFNLISREFGEREPYSSILFVDPNNLPDEYEDYANDLEHLMKKNKGWSITVLASSGALEPEYPTQIHFGIGGPKGQPLPEAPDESLMVKDIDTYRQFYDEVEKVMLDKFGFTIDHQKTHASTNPRCIYRQLDVKDSNHILMRIEWDKMLWDYRNILLCHTLAEIISTKLAHAPLPENPLLKVKDIGYDDYLK